MRGSHDVLHESHVSAGEDLIGWYAELLNDKLALLWGASRGIDRRTSEICKCNSGSTDSPGGLMN